MKNENKNETNNIETVASENTLTLVETPKLKVERLQAEYEPLNAAAEKKKSVLDAKEKFVEHIRSELEVTIQARNILKGEIKTLQNEINAKEEILTYRMKASRKPLEAREEMVKKGLLPVEMNLVPDENVKKELQGMMAQATSDLKEMRTRLGELKSDEWMAKKDIVPLRNARYYHGKRLQGIAADYEAANQKADTAQKKMLEAETEVRNQVQSTRRTKIWTAIKYAAVYAAVAVVTCLSFTGKPSITRTAESQLNDVQTQEQFVNAVLPSEKKADMNVFKVNDGEGYEHVAKTVLGTYLPGFSELAAIEQNGMISKMSQYLQTNRRQLGITREMENPRKGESAPWLNKGAALTFAPSNMNDFVKSLGPGKQVSFRPALNQQGNLQFSNTSASMGTSFAGANILRR